MLNLVYSHVQSPIQPSASSYSSSFRNMVYSSCLAERSANAALASANTSRISLGGRLASNNCFPVFRHRVNLPLAARRTFLACSAMANSKFLTGNSRSSDNGPMRSAKRRLEENTRHRLGSFSIHDLSVMTQETLCSTHMYII